MDKIYNFGNNTLPSGIGYTPPNYSGTASSGTSSTGGSSTGFFSSGFGQSLLSSGVSTFFSVVGGLIGSKQEKDRLNQQSDIVAKNVEGQLAIEQERTKQAQLMANSQKAGASGNTALYVGLGIGALVLFAVVIFAVTRKK